MGYLSTMPVHKNGHLVQKLKAFPVLSGNARNADAFLLCLSFCF